MTTLDLYELSAPQLVRIYGERLHNYRLHIGLTQQEVAERAGVSMLTVQRFESGRAANITFATFLQLLKAIGQINEMDRVLQELPSASYLSDTTNIRKRVKHSHGTTKS